MIRGPVPILPFLQKKGLWVWHLFVVLGKRQYHSFVPLFSGPLSLKHGKGSASSSQLQSILLPAVVCVRLTYSSVPQTVVLFHMCLLS